MVCMSAVKQTIAERIQQLRLQMVIHSAIYYVLNDNIISDNEWSTRAKELVRLQEEYPEVASQVIYADDFKDFDGSTGFTHLTRCHLATLGIKYTDQKQLW